MKPDEFKLNRIRLRRDYASGALKPLDFSVRRGDAEADELLCRVRAIVAQAVNRAEDDVAFDADFFLDLGGTSLDYFAMLTRLRDTFDAAFPFEETGLLLARPAPARTVAGPWRDFLGQGASPDLDALDFVARAITPPYRPKRFDARFFMAEADRLASLDRAPDCGELDELAWVELSETLALDLPNITRFVVQELALRLEHPDRPAPFVSFRRGARRLEHL